MQIVKVYQYGGPEVIKVEEIPTLPSPGPGQALVELKACGVNFIDVYQRSGAYKIPLPFVIGLEGAGIVASIGPGVSEVKPGDRVAFAGIPESYASHVLAPADRLVSLPSDLSFEQGAAAMLQGMTAHYLSHSAYPLKKGDTCLIHASAGGVGQLLCQMAKMAGAKVFGTVSSDEKAQVAKQAGADEVIRYDEKDFEAEARRLTGGKGVNVVYDSVGKTTFEKSLGSLAIRGYLVLFGQSSGPVPPFDCQILNAKGSLFLTRPTLGHYTATREELLKRAGDVFGWISAKKLRLAIDRILPLTKAAEAHRKLEGRQTKGKIVLLPEAR